MATDVTLQSVYNSSSSLMVSEQDKPLAAAPQQQKDELTPALQSGYHQLPESLLSHIMGFVGQAHETVLVSKAFFHYTAESAKDLLVTWMNDPSVLPIIAPVIGSNTIAGIEALAQDNAMIRESLLPMVRACSMRIQAEEDRNLHLFYQRLLLQLPRIRDQMKEDDRATASCELAMSCCPKMEGTISKRAAAIRTWMNSAAAQGMLLAITDLNLSNANLTMLPREIQLFVNVENLDCHNNQLCALPRVIGKLGKLRELDLRHNQLAALPSDMGKLKNLWSLNLGDNQFALFPQVIEKLDNLQMLALESNQLTALPPEIGKLVNLQTLTLEYNQLAAVPPEIGKLTQLQMLILSNNKLTAVPSEMGQLANLLTLYLSDNQLTELPQEIRELTFKTLQTLELDNNPLLA